MALYGSTRDISFFRGISRELINNIIEQEVAYYKINLKATNNNVYGESVDKFFNEPFLINCLITRGDQAFTESDFGPDVTRTMGFAFLRDDLVEDNLVPEVGDIIVWQEKFFEVNQIVENDLVMGKSEQYYFSEYLQNYGSSISILCNAHLTRPEKVGISRQRL
jgi:hypothetical protein